MSAMITEQHKAQLLLWVEKYRPELISRPMSELSAVDLLEAARSLDIPVQTLAEVSRTNAALPLREEVAPSTAEANLPRGVERCEWFPGANGVAQVTDDEVNALIGRLAIMANAYVHTVIEAVFDADELLEASRAFGVLDYEQEAAVERAMHAAKARIAELF